MQKILGQKLALIALIALLLWIPLQWIHSQVQERQQYLDGVRADVATSWTGTQAVMAPVLVIGYESRTKRAVSQLENGTTTYKEMTEQHQIFLPADTASVTGNMVTEMRYKSIYGVPVYLTELTIKGAFAPQPIANTLTQLQQQKDFARLTGVFLAMHIRDPRGIEGSPQMIWRKQTLKLLPGSGLRSLSDGIRAEIENDFSTDSSTGSPFEFEIRMALRGMESLQVIPSAKMFSFDAESTWPHPEFFGAFLPTTRQITNSGFSARWSVNEFSTSISGKLAACAQAECGRLLESQFGINLFQSVDVYQQTNRAMKYAMLFVALTFAVFFIFENLQQTPIHPIQYLFVGLALVIFYLLLLSLSEHVAFARAYAIASLACCALNGFYVRHVMQGWLAAGVFTGVLAALYGVLFVILQMEDYAQLTGAGLVFAMLAATMILTRRIDWYQLKIATKKTT